MTVRRTSSEAAGVAADLQRVVEARQLEHVERRVARARLPPPQLGSAGLPDEQRGRGVALQRLDDLGAVEQRRQPGGRAAPRSVAAMLPSDLPTTATMVSALAGLRSARSAWPRIHSNGSSSGRRPLVDLHHRPAVRLRRLAREPEQRRLAEVADPGQETAQRSGSPSCRITERP